MLFFVRNKGGGWVLVADGHQTVHRSDKTLNDGANKLVAREKLWLSNLPRTDRLDH